MLLIYLQKKSVCFLEYSQFKRRTFSMSLMLIQMSEHFASQVDQLRMFSLKNKTNVKTQVIPLAKFILQSVAAPGFYDRGGQIVFIVTTLQAPNNCSVRHRGPWPIEFSSTGGPRPAAPLAPPVIVVSNVFRTVVIIVANKSTSKTDWWPFTQGVGWVSGQA